MGKKRTSKKQQALAEITQQGEISAKNLWLWALGPVLLWAVLYSFCLDSQRTGFVHDDGVYLITAKALAGGQGYVLSHLVTPLYEVKYPALYPWLLSWVWRWEPSFPENLIAFGWMNIVLLCGGLLVSFYYLVRQGASAAMASYIVLLTGGNALIVTYSTLAMSEGAFLLFSMGALIAAEKALGKPTWQNLLICGLWAALAYHTRTLGFLLVIALVLALLFKREFRAAFLYFLGTSLLTIVPWTVWVKTHREPLSLENFALLHPYQPYWDDFWEIAVTNGYLHLFFTAFHKLLADVAKLLFPLTESLGAISFRSGILSLGIAAYFIFLGWALFQKKPLPQYAWILAVYLLSILIWPNPFENLWWFVAGYILWQGITAVRKKEVSVSALYLLLTVLVVTLWPYPSQYRRFLCVVLPLLWLYLLRPVWEKLKTNSSKPVRALVLAGILVLAMGSTPSTYAGRWITANHHRLTFPTDPMLWKDYQQVFNHVKQNFPKDAVIGTYTDVVFNLYTGRPTLFIVGSCRKYHVDEDEKSRQASYEILMRNLDHYEMDYLILEPEVAGLTLRQKYNPTARELLRRYPDRFVRVFDSANGYITIYRKTDARN